jgi:hypothetical protein
VIIAIVVVISLVVVALLLGVLENNSDVGGTAQQVSNQLSTVALNDAVLGTGTDANGLIVLTNNTGELIKNVRISIDGKDHNYFGINIPHGNKTTFQLNTLEIPCPYGQDKIIKTITIKYTTKNNLEKTQTIENTTLQCTPTTNPTPTTTPTTEKQQNDGLTQSPGLEIRDFKLSGMVEDNMLQYRGIAFSLKNNFPSEVLITEIKLDDYNLEYETTFEYGFTMTNRINKKEPGHMLSSDYPELIDDSTLRSNETRVVTVQLSTLIGCKNLPEGGDPSRDCDYSEIESKKIGETYSINISIKYEYNEIEYETQTQTITSTIENIKGAELVSYYTDPFDISELHASAGKSDRGIGFIFTNVLDDEVTINSIKIQDTDNKPEFQFFPTTLVLTDTTLNDYYEDYPEAWYYPYRLVKVTNGRYPNGGYIEDHQPLNNPILFESGEKNGLLIDHGNVTSSLEYKPAGTFYAPHSLIFNITYKNQNYEYHFRKKWYTIGEYEHINGICASTHTENVTGKDLFEYYG